uniref:ETS domain-containing protein n=1 Tax=Parastrongyloides trichosuri TaxID=131310 RepID=A0A0N4ZWS1_PARTI
MTSSQEKDVNSILKNNDYFLNSLPTTIDGRTKVKTPLVNYIDYSSCPYNMKLLQLRKSSHKHSNQLWSFLLFLLSNKKDYGKLIYWCGPCGLFRISNIEQFLSLWELLNKSKDQNKVDIIRCMERYSRKYKFIKIIGKHRRGDYFYKFDLKHLNEYLNKKRHKNDEFGDNFDDVDVVKNNINNIILSYEKKIVLYMKNELSLDDLENHKNFMVMESKNIIFNFINKNEGNEANINLGLSMLYSINTLSQIINYYKENKCLNK